MDGTAGIVIHLLGALSLFLLGLDELGQALGSLGTERLRPLLARFSRTPLLGLLTGTVVTVVLDSSSAVIVMLIALVNAGALPFAQALGIVLGANIGTTIGGQIIALDIAYLGAGLLAVGVAGRLLLKLERARLVLAALQGVGLVFFGLELMDMAVSPLRDSPETIERLAALTAPLQGALAGAIATIVLQSSSAVVGMAIGLASSGVLPLAAGVALMLGAEVGTCADTLVASIGRGANALRVGLFHLGFNAVSTLLGLLMIGLLTDFARWSAPPDQVGRQLANAHVLFNTVGALAAVGLVPHAARLLERVVKDRAPPTSERANGVSEPRP